MSARQSPAPAPVIVSRDICYQDGGNSCVRGYSGGTQKAWLERELAASRENRDIDWIVVCMHQVAVSTVDKFNGADLGIREEWVPLFDGQAVACLCHGEGALVGRPKRYDVVGPGGEIAAFETFTLRRPRRD